MSETEPRTSQTLAYLAVLAALRLESGVPFHVAHARQLGASRAEVISAILVGLPAAGNAVTQALPAALRAYDEAWKPRRPPPAPASYPAHGRSSAARIGGSRP